MRTFLLFLAAAMTLSPSVPSASPVTDRAWTTLKEGLENFHPGSRAKAVHSLGLAGRRTQGMAEKALTDPDKGVRSEAAIALGQMDAISARPKLRECLKDKEVQVVLSCANTLFGFKDPAAYEVYFAVLTGKERSHEGLLESQLDTLRDRKQLEKLAFETGIGFVPFGGTAWQAIKTVTHNDSTPVRVLATERLAKDMSPNTTKALLEFITDKKPQIRDAVVKAIAHRGDPELINAVETRLDDDDESVRYDAAAAVISLEGAKPAPAKRNRKSTKAAESPHE